MAYSELEMEKATEFCILPQTMVMEAIGERLFANVHFKYGQFSAAWQKDIQARGFERSGFCIRKIFSAASCNLFFGCLTQQGKSGAKGQKHRSCAFVWMPESLGKRSLFH